MLTTKTAVVVNPASANGLTGKRWPEIAEIMKEEGLNFDATLTSRPGEGTVLTKRYLEQGYELIIAVGGDGTVNEVINGFFDEQGILINKKAAFSFISTGNGRDLARTVGISRDPREAVNHIINSVPRQVDLGRVSFNSNVGERVNRFFINVAGLGLDGETVARVNRTTKVFGGFISFLWGTLISLLLYKNKHMSVEVDGKVVCDEPLVIAIFGNGRFFGGGMKIAPHALMDDGFFDVVILGNLSKFNLVCNLPRVYQGTHLNHPRITSLRGKTVKIKSSDRALLNLDGEQPGEGPVEVEILPSALNLRA